MHDLAISTTSSQVPSSSVQESGNSSMSVATGAMRSTPSMPVNRPTGGAAAPSRPQMLSLSDLALNEPRTSSAANVTVTSQAVGLSTPTPTQFLIPRKGTAEQEEFSLGFEQALENIYRSRGVSKMGGDDSMNSDSSVTDEQADGGSWSTGPGSNPSAGMPGDSNRLQPEMKMEIGNDQFPVGASMAGMNPVNPLLYGKHTVMPTCGATSILPNSFVGAPLRSIPVTAQDLAQDAGPCTYTTLEARRPLSAATIPSAVYPSTGITASSRLTYSPNQQIDPSSVHIRNNFQAGSPALPYLSGMPPQAHSGAYRPQHHAAFDSNGVTRSNGPMAVSDLRHEPYLPTIKCEPESGISLGGSLDLNEQERMKLERKRAKNRIAAQKCQMRKVEKITRLEDKVSKLHEQNANLAQTVAALNEHIAELRRQIIVHANRGCRLMVPNIPSAGGVMVNSVGGQMS